MTVQTSYNDNIDIKLAGLIYDMGNTNVDSFKAEGAVGFGVFASRGSSVDQIVVGGAAAVGVAVRSQNENDYPQGAIDAGEYANTETVGVLREGFIWAQFDVAGGVVGDVVTINAAGQVVVAGGATALTHIKARIEKPASEVTVGGDGGNGVFVGLVAVSLN